MIIIRSFFGGLGVGGTDNWVFCTVIVKFDRKKTLSSSSIIPSNGIFHCHLER